VDEHMGLHISTC